MLLEKGNITRKHIDNYFYNLGFNVVPDIEASNMDFLIECAKINLVITSVLKSFVKKDLENGLLIELSIAPKIPSRYIGIAYKKNATLSIASNRLIEFLQSSIIE